MPLIFRDRSFPSTAEWFNGSCTGRGCKSVGIYAVVIPAYNEAATLRSVAQRALAFSSCVIIVDDGSTDDSAARVDDLPVVLLRNAVNQGKAASLWQGMQHALHLGADAIITLDADGQHAPEDIPALIGAGRSHPRHIIIGARLRDPASIPASRYIANRIANFWISWDCLRVCTSAMIASAGLCSRARC